MSEALRILVQSSLVGALIALVSLVLTRLLANRLRASVRHACLLVAFAAVLVAPLTGLLPPVSLAVLPERLPEAEPLVSAWSRSSVPGSAARVAAREARIANGTNSALPWGALAIAVWLVGTGLGLARLVAERVSLRRHWRTADRELDAAVARVLAQSRQRLGLRREVGLGFSESIDVPLTFGLLRAFVLLPRAAREWPERRLAAVLDHELAHVHRRDCAAQSLAAVVVALHWHDPLLRFLAQRFVRERELACDEHVIACGRGGVSYAEELLAVARSLPRQGLGKSGARRVALGMGDGGALEERVAAILRDQPARAFGRRSVGVGIAVLVGSAWPFFASIELEPVLGERGARALEALLADGRVEVRAASLDELARRGHRSTFYTVIDCWDDAEPLVRRACLRALTGIGCVPAFVAVAEALEDSDASVRAEAARLVTAFEHGFEERALDRVRGKKWQGKAWASLDRVLPRSDARSVRARLLAASDDSAPSVREAARSALASLDARAEPR